MLLALSEPQAAMLAAGWTGIVCVAGGSALLSRLQLTWAEWIPLSFLAGAPLLSTLVLLLGIAGLVSPAIYLIVGLAAIAAGACWRPRLLGPAGPGLPKFWRWTVVAVMVPFVALYALTAAGPEVSADGVAYHLAYPARYAQAQRIMPVPTDLLAMMPAGVEMLFLYAFVFGQHAAAALVHLLFLFALAGLLFLAGQRAGNPKAGITASLLVFISPLAGRDATCAYVDVAAAAYSFGVFYALERWRDRGESSWALLAGLFAGAACAAKYTAVMAAVYGVWVILRQREHRSNAGWQYAAATVAIAAPWLVRNAVWYENPCAPFLNQFFPNPHVSVIFEREFAANMRHFGSLASAWDVPWEAIVRGGALQGLLGPVFLLLPLCLIGWRQPMVQRPLVAALFFAVLYPSNLGARFLLTALAPLALAFGFTMERFRLALPLILVHAVLSWPAQVERYAAPDAWRLERLLLKDVWRRAWRPDIRREYRHQALGGGKVLAYLSQLPETATVYTMTSAPNSYLRCLIRADYHSTANRVLQEQFFMAAGVDRWREPRHLLTFSLTAAPVRALRLVQIGREPKREWSVAELQVTTAQGELPVADVHAWPFPWWARYTHDALPITSWQANQPATPGQYLEIHLSRPEPVRELRVRAREGLQEFRFRLEAQRGSGAWETVAVMPRDEQVPPLPGLRRSWTDQLRRAGIQHVVIHDSGYGAQDLREHAGEYGMDQAVEEHGTRVYRLREPL